MAEKRPLGKIRVTRLPADDASTPTSADTTEPGRHRRPTDREIHIPAPRKPSES